MVGEQLQKIAATRSKAAEDKVAGSMVAAAQKTESAKAPPAPFDVGKFAGIFAAIGLAVGALGTAVASLLTGMLALKWWQMPLALVGLLLVVSGPSMLIAAFKLRGRNLGPILDANGWAVNSRARINIPFGAALTATARLPEGAERALVDPFAEKKQPWGLYLGVALLLATVAGGIWWRFF
jgi:Na+(H+)/acetate symporter ActP